VHIEWGEEAGVVSIHGDVDVPDGPELRSALPRASLATRLPVLDMRGVTFLGSEGLRAIVTAVRAPAGVVLTILPSRPVRRVLDVTGVVSATPMCSRSGGRRSWKNFFNRGL
jgi:anti-anti-sigma factor